MGDLNKQLAVKFKRSTFKVSGLTLNLNYKTMNDER